MEGLGALGFWLGLGIFLAGGAIAGALKERVKEREKQATLRALLEGEGEVTPEVLAYLREKDAAEMKLLRQAWGLDWGKGVGAAGMAGVSVVVLAIIAGFVSLAHTSPRREFITTPGDIQAGVVPRGEWVTTAPPGFDFPLAPLVVMIAIWAAGFIIAALIWRFSGKKQNDAQPGA